MLKEATPQAIYLKDYQVPNFHFHSVELDFDLFEDHTIVTGVMQFSRSPDASKSSPLVLNQAVCERLSIKIDGKEVEASRITEKEEDLLISDVPDRFELTVVSKIKPHENKACEGLYKSGDIYCTQNEPEGMRRILPFPDRSDMMAVYQTTVRADKKKYPYLLSNGNKAQSGELDGGRHFVTWKDPFKKPSYLFALVAGDFDLIEDHFTTMSGRKIKLEIFSDKGNGSRCWHAMQSLKDSMKWDEEVFGLEYDLDIYMIVAVDAFNMGAMENKGLNVFNTACVLADAKSATDVDFHTVQGVVGHEYFHNWTGNRVTLRDWFQLTLKEGLTVFRDQEFSSDLGARTVERIKNVNTLRTFQFPEDAGPMAHPIRPQSYIEINNFYTSTVYNKGSEIIRMIHTLLGKENFRKGMDLYFQRHDGQAVTTDDFVQAMSDASGINLTAFKESWYNQLGTPEVHMSTSFNKERKEFTFSFRQNCRETKELSEQRPFVIPLKTALLSRDGKNIPFTYQGKKQDEIVLDFSMKEQSFVLEEVEAEEVFPSVNRDFSAPIYLRTEMTEQDLAWPASLETDAFNRWESLQEIFTKEIQHLISLARGNNPLKLRQSFKDVFLANVHLNSDDLSFWALLLTPPAASLTLEGQKTYEIEETLKAHQFLKKELGQTFAQDFEKLYQKFQNVGGEDQSLQARGARELKGICLSYLCYDSNAPGVALAKEQYFQKKNMTETMSALRAINDLNISVRSECLDDFYNEWKHDSLVMTKWFFLQSSSLLEAPLARIQKIMELPEYVLENPNHLRSVFRGIIRTPDVFHTHYEEMYPFVSDFILKVDQFNPSMSSGIALGLQKVSKLDSRRKAAMEKEIDRMLKEELSRNTYEVLKRAKDSL